MYMTTTPHTVHSPLKRSLNTESRHKRGGPWSLLNTPAFTDKISLISTHNLNSQKKKNMEG